MSLQRVGLHSISVFLFHTVFRKIVSTNKFTVLENEKKRSNNHDPVRPSAALYGHLQRWTTPLQASTALQHFPLVPVHQLCISSDFEPRLWIVLYPKYFTLNMQIEWNTMILHNDLLVLLIIYYLIRRVLGADVLSWPLF